ncbi:HAMP domain-containing sensor histidine kinase [Rhodohalobacter sp. SW132]|uniref:sensor histidine kinase n=1 Tax=Rhodohalobacter sp. SW132 TaxID=2293433 RepID=UPI00131535B0|nr:HAMP domain-containing sensor histidine kinase [Rhodohalobacter sp. SW132]
MKNLNHDLRSPLGGIAGMLDLLIPEENTDQVDVQTSDLNMIKESARSILDLINSTLLIEDTDKNLVEKKTERLLSSAIMEINRLYLPMAQNKRIALSMSTQIDTEVPLPHDFYINLIQITGNLVANGIKFTPPKGSVKVVFTLDEERNKNTMNMIVTDTGKGMLPGQVSAFNQGKPVEKSIGTSGEKGSGIGLQHVKQMVSELNGSVFVKRKKEKGTEFSLSFPLPDQNLDRKSASHLIVQNGRISYNGHHS